MEGVVFTGVPSNEELCSCPGMPSDVMTRRKKLPRIECVQEIPCNPCEAICPTGAIQIGENITALPRLYAELCTGCGLCVANCPGLAITLIDKSLSKDEAVVDFPFEYLPLPSVDDVVEAVGRDGEVVCNAKVLKIKQSKAYDCTTVISILIPSECADDVVSMKRMGLKV